MTAFWVCSVCLFLVFCWIAIVLYFGIDALLGMPGQSKLENGDRSLRYAVHGVGGVGLIEYIEFFLRNEIWYVQVSVVGISLIVFFWTFRIANRKFDEYIQSLPYVRTINVTDTVT